VRSIETPAAKTSVKIFVMQVISHFRNYHATPSACSTSIGLFHLSVIASEPMNFLIVICQVPLHARKHKNGKFAIKNCQIAVASIYKSYA